MRETYLNLAKPDKKDNYAMTCETWRKIFLDMDHDALAQRFGLKQDGNALYITYYQECYLLDRHTGMILLKDDPDRRLPFNTVMSIYHLFHYSKANAALKGEFVPFRKVKGAAPFDPAFQRTVLTPLARTFSGKASALEQACTALNGQPIRQGDVGYVIHAFDCMPVTVVFWDGDEEFDAQANILFDANITDYLHEETVVCLASDLVRRLTEEAGIRPKGALMGREY